MDENKALFKQQKRNAGEYLRGIEDSEQEIKQMMHEHSNASSMFHRSRSALPKEIPSLLLDNPVSFSLFSHWLPDFIDNFTSVSFINPNEHLAHRSQTTRALKWRYNGEKADAISFSVSQDVLLTGIGVCRPYKSGRKVSVKRLNILIGKGTSGKSIYTHKKKNAIEYGAGLSVQQIKLDAPIILKRNQFYSAVFVIEGDSSYKCVDCIDRFSAGSIVWEFFSTDFNGVLQSNRSDVACGPIANFQFERLNK